MMRHLVPTLLAAFLLVVSFRPCAAGDELERAIRHLLPRTSPAELGQYFTAIELTDVKRTLAQIRASEQAGTAQLELPPQRERVELTLEKSIEIALRRNFNIQIATLSKDALEQEISRAKALFHPTVGLALTGSGQRPVTTTGAAPEVNSQDAAPFIQTLLPTGTTIIVSLDLNRTTTAGGAPTVFTSSDLLTARQPLFRGGRPFVVTKPIRDAEFDARIETAKLKAQILRVIAATKSAYYTTALAENVIEVTEAALARDKALLDASIALFKAGLVTQRDVLSAEISQAKDVTRLISARAGLDTAQYALADVLGLSIGIEPVLLDRKIGFQPIPPALDTWIAQAITNRPEVLQLKEQLGKSALNVRALKNLLLPQVDLIASYGRAQSAVTFGKSLDLSGDIWSAGILFSFPLGNVAARSALTRAEIEHARFQAQLVQQQRSVELEVRAAEIKLRRNLERTKSLTIVAEKAQGKLEVANARFALGVATNFDVTDAQADLLSAETDLLTAIVDYNIGLAELEASIAGPI